MNNIIKCIKIKYEPYFRCLPKIKYVTNYKQFIEDKNRGKIK